jgi:uncharacterized protein (DUF302 family)
VAENARRVVTVDEDSGISRLMSQYPVDQTTDRIQATLQAKGLAIFCVVDHSGEARRAGLEMRPTKLVIFGNPRAGTPVMVASPSTAIDLPLKALVYEDAAGTVWVTFNSPEYLRRRHHIPYDLVGNISAAGALIQAAIK